MANLSKQIEAEKENIERALTNLAFRHFFDYGYGFMLEKAPLERLANNIPNIWSQFFSKIEALVGPKNTND